MDDISVVLLLFAQAKELVGTGSLILRLPASYRETKKQHLLDYIIQKFQNLHLIRDSLTIAINQEYLSV